MTEIMIMLLTICLLAIGFWCGWNFRQYHNNVLYAGEGTEDASSED